MNSNSNSAEELYYLLVTIYNSASYTSVLTSMVSRFDDLLIEIPLREVLSVALSSVKMKSPFISCTDTYNFSIEGIVYHNNLNEKLESNVLRLCH